MLQKWCMVGLPNSCCCILALTILFWIIILYDKGVGKIKDDNNSEIVVFNELATLGMRNKEGLALQHGEWRIWKEKKRKFMGEGKYYKKFIDSN